MLYIIFGATGVGKTRLCETINNMPSFTLIKKATTRKPTPTDGHELCYVSEEELHRDYDINFPYYTDADPKYFFGLRSSELEEATRDTQGKYFLFCNHMATAVSINETHDNVKTLLFQIDNYRELVYRESKSNPDVRLMRMEHLQKITRDNMFRFDGILFYKVRSGGDKKSHSEVRNQLFSFIRGDSDCKDYLESVSTEVAVMMPQGERPYEQHHYDSVYEAIKSAVETTESGEPTRYTAKRITGSSQIIINEILDSIKLANRVIVDLSQSRANCYFEAGYALGQDKRILFICDKFSDVSYNVSTYNVMRYDLDNEKEKLTDMVRQFINS